MPADAAKDRRFQRRINPHRICGIPPFEKREGRGTWPYRKLLEKQEEGKKRMDHVDIPQEAFLAVLKVG